MKAEILSFTSEMIPEAGRLLAQQHKRHRVFFPQLPERFEDPQVAARAVETLWKEKLRRGYAAFCYGRMAAYLVGQTATNPWGRSGYVYLPGYAAAEGESPTLLQDLYSALGDDWVRKGCFNHYMYISAADQAAINALFDLGFGKERADALLDLRSLEDSSPEAPAGVVIRKAGPGDELHLGSLSNTIFRALAKAPHWHPTVPEDWDDLREGWSELAEDKEWSVWLALENDQALGIIGFRAEQETDTQMLASPGAVYLSVAATKPEARGRGINSYLTWQGLRQ